MLEELKKTNFWLDQIARHFDNFNDRLQSVKSRLGSIETNRTERLSPTSSSTELKKIDVT